MPRIRYIGGYIKFKENIDQEKRTPTAVPLVQETALFHAKEEEEEEEIIEEERPMQTFPASNQTIRVVRQKEDDLTCGLRCLQNMYGEWIVDKKEIDTVASKLQERSHGIELFNPNLGFYAMEVLEVVLQQKGKWVQRIDIDKISPEYYLPIVACNPTFTGYIVTLGTGTLKHYVAIRYSGSYRKIDSMPGVAPCQIGINDLLRRRDDGLVYCNGASQCPVVCLAAVGGSPFVEYNMLHSTWSHGIPDVSAYQSAIVNSLDWNKQVRRTLTSEENDWYRKWQTSRVMPSQKVLDKLERVLRTAMSLKRDVIVHNKDQRTIIRCGHLDELLKNLKTMGWTSSDVPFTFVQSGNVRYHSESPGVNQIDWTDTIHIEPPKHPQIGGFYTFRSSVSGTCTEKQASTYTVRDKDGHTHVLLKKSVCNIRIEND